MTQSSLSSISDYPALQQLSAALWGAGKSKGAAVFIGAGFSRNAERAGRDTPSPPLWHDLRQGMVDVLYAGRSDEAPADPLRLAEEFHTCLGRSALMEFLRQKIPDTSWLPGLAHKRLLALPWTDVLTTNYDTLLERGSELVSKRFNLIKTPADLAQFSSPRIIKLHGSIESSERVILTEEDYRTYPTQAAAFVNTARQIFIENELCLLGFSGDDPNFLQWSGWVRDHLSTGARKIFLVGNLNLNATKRRYFETKNICPIDLADLVRSLPGAEADGAACGLLLSFLESSRPKRVHDWNPSDSEDYLFLPNDILVQRESLKNVTSATDILTKLEVVWTKDVESCPDWLVMPRRKRKCVKHESSIMYGRFEPAIKMVSSNLRCKLLLDVMWRREQTLQQLEESLLAIAWETVREDLPINQKINMLRHLLREARQQRDQTRFEEAIRTLSVLSEEGSDARAECLAQQAMWARDGLDLDNVLLAIPAIEQLSFPWRQLSASLYCECGNLSEAYRITTGICKDLEERLRRDPESIWIKSGLAWVRRAARAYYYATTFDWKPFTTEETDIDYNVYREVEEMENELQSKRLSDMIRPTQLQPKFAPGSYSDPQNVFHFRSGYLGEDADAVFRLADMSGSPLRVGSVSVLDQLALEALKQEPCSTIQWHLRLIRVLSHDPSKLNEMLEQTLSRVSVAKLSHKVSHELYLAIFKLAKFWHQRTSKTGGAPLDTATSRLQAALRILSRLVVRATVDEAKEVFEFGVDLARRLADLSPSLYEALDELLNWSLGSLPPFERSKLVLPCLDVPLPSVDYPQVGYWPEPAGELFRTNTPVSRPPGDAFWRASVAHLIKSVANRGVARTRAVHRLAFLHLRNALELDEQEQFGRLLWHHLDPGLGGLPADVDLFPHVVAVLPCPLGIDARSIATSYLFQGLIDINRNQLKKFNNIVAAQREGNIVKIEPNHEEALSLLDQIYNVGRHSDTPDDPFSSGLKKAFQEFAGSVIGAAVLPKLESADLTPERRDFLEQCSGPGRGGGVLAAWHEMARLSPTSSGKVAAGLRRAIFHNDLHDVTASAASIVAWSSVAGQDCPLPDNLKDTIPDALALGIRPGVAEVIWCARKLVEARQLSPVQLRTISDLFPGLWDDLAYEQLPSEGPQAVGVTRARVECVRLAASLKACGMDVAAGIFDVGDDPLPEVRFAFLSV